MRRGSLFEFLAVAATVIACNVALGLWLAHSRPMNPHPLLVVAQRLLPDVNITGHEVAGDGLPTPDRRWARR